MHETADLLEESQTHALVETPNAVTAYALAQATWRMTATSCWALSELQPMHGETEPAARLHAPAPIFAHTDGEISPQLAAFVARVNRLHERARKLEELSRGPIVSTENPPRTVTPAEDAHEIRPAAPVIKLFSNDVDRKPPANVVRDTRHQLDWMLAAQD
jgi:uncharacterized protein YjiS (DUF1127 family)